MATICNHIIPVTGRSNSRQPYSVTLDGAMSGIGYPTVNDKSPDAGNLSAIFTAEINRDIEGNVTAG